MKTAKKLKKVKNSHGYYHIDKNGLAQGQLTDNHNPVFDAISLWNDKNSRNNGIFLTIDKDID